MLVYDTVRAVRPSEVRQHAEYKFFDAVKVRLYRENWVYLAKGETMQGVTWAPAALSRQVRRQNCVFSAY